MEDWEKLRYQAYTGNHRDLYLGRAPVDSELELSNFVRKTLAHEPELRSYNTNYLYNGLMVGEFYGYPLLCIIFLSFSIIFICLKIKKKAITKNN